MYDNKDHSNWFGTSDFNDEDRKVPRLVCFYGILDLHDVPDEYPVDISADGRYKLFVNGRFVQAGPQKGDDQIHFYDTADLSAYLMQGRNNILVQLLVYPSDRTYGNHSIFRSGTPRLYFDPQLDWLTCTDRTVLFPPEEEGFAPLCIHEVHTFPEEKILIPAEELDPGTLPEILRPQNMRPRDIPAAVKIPHEFDLPVTFIPADSETSFILDAGEEMCAYLTLEIAGGKNAQIELLYSEQSPAEAGADRPNAAVGHPEGYKDIYEVSGGGPELECFSPFWFRTFRSIRVRIRTGGEPLSVRSLKYEETGYPLNAVSAVSTSDSTLGPIWDISLRKLRRCMHDTYIDCPFYEQLQYIMDTRAEILYTYAVSGDDRLAKRTIRDFSRALRSCGLLNCSYPNVNDNIIPGFSLYYVLMVHDHMMYFGDRELIAEVFPAIKTVLAFFRQHLNEQGLVGKTGGVNGKGPLWSFIDWAEQWMDTSGMPPAGLNGPLTMESLLYILALDAAADLLNFLKSGSGNDYRSLAASVRLAVRKECMSEDGMITDGPGSGDLSQHCQVFGTLACVLTPGEAVRNLRRTISDPAVTKCTVATMFYVFRAFEKAGLYAETERCWDIWRKMVSDGCTTSIEGENYARSKCHAWGAAILYELPSVILGVRPAAPGYEKISVRPVPGYLTSAEGTACTPFGKIHVSWHLADGKPVLGIKADDPVLQRIVSYPAEAKMS